MVNVCVKLERRRSYSTLPIWRHWSVFNEKNCNVNNVPLFYVGYNLFFRPCCAVCIITRDKYLLVTDVSGRDKLHLPPFHYIKYNLQHTIKASTLL